MASSHADWINPVAEISGPKTPKTTRRKPPKTFSLSRCGTADVDPFLLLLHPHTRTARLTRLGLAVARDWRSGSAQPTTHDHDENVISCLGHKFLFRQGR